MKRVGKVIAVLVIIGAGVAMYNYATADRNGTACSGISYEQVTKAIQDDFLKSRMPTWDKDAEALGTRTPELAFDKDGTRVTDTYLVPFKASGPGSSLNLFATYVCKNGNIEYSRE